MLLWTQYNVINAMLWTQHHDCNNINARFWMQVYECNVMLLWMQYNVMNAMLDIMIMLLIAVAAGQNLSIFYIYL